MSEGTQEPASSVKSDITSSTEKAQTPHVAGGPRGPHRIVKRSKSGNPLRENKHLERDWKIKERKDYEKKLADVSKTKSDTNDSTASSGAKILSWKDAEEIERRRISAKTGSSRAKLLRTTPSSSASGAHAPSAPTERPSGDAVPTEASLPPEPSDGSSREPKSSTE